MWILMCAYIHTHVYTHRFVHVCVGFVNVCMHLKSTYAMIHDSRHVSFWHIIDTFMHKLTHQVYAYTCVLCLHIHHVYVYIYACMYSDMRSRVHIMMCIPTQQILSFLWHVHAWRCPCLSRTQKVRYTCVGARAKRSWYTVRTGTRTWARLFTYIHTCAQVCGEQIGTSAYRNMCMSTFVYIHTYMHADMWRADGHISL
jgi:hypothetical protein